MLKFLEALQHSTRLPNKSKANDDQCKSLEAMDTPQHNQVGKSTVSSETAKSTVPSQNPHPFHMDERVAFSVHINNHLIRDIDLARHLPLDVETPDIFAKVNDGLILCKVNF